MLRNDTGRVPDPVAATADEPGPECTVIHRPAEASIIDDDQLDNQPDDGRGLSPAAALTRRRMHRDNLAYAGTSGVSSEGRRQRFEPAFRDEHSGRVEVSRTATGLPAPIHVMDGLPAEWIGERDPEGRPSALLPGIVAGFVRDGRFYTREEAAALAD